MVRDRLWNGAVRKPRTAFAVPSVMTAPGGRSVRVECPTPGASLGFRRAGDDAWTPVTGPISINDAGETLELLAHRIGFEPRRLHWSFPPAGQP